MTTVPDEYSGAAPIAGPAERQTGPDWRTRWARRLLASVAFALIASPLLADLQAAATASGDSAEPATSGVEEIVVTARQRKELLQSVPIAVTALSKYQLLQLESTGENTIQQLQMQVPSLQIQGFNPRNATMTIRGLGTNSGTTNDGLEQGVGVYIDGVYMARPSITTFELADLEQLEVLRGPQGTLFGKNTTAGVVNIATKAPTFDNELDAEAIWGNYGRNEYKLIGNAVLSDQIAVRLNGYEAHQDGNIRNTHYNANWNNNNSEGLHGQVLWTPTDDFKLRLSADINLQQEEGGFYVVRGILPPNRADGSAGVNFNAKIASLGYSLPPIDPSVRQTDIDSSQELHMKTGGYSAQADWDMSGLTLTSISAYHYWIWSPNLDGDSFGLPIITAFNIPTHQKQFSQELRIASPTDQTVEYTAGLYYFWQESIDYGRTTYGASAAGWYLGPAAPSAALNNFSNISYQSPKTNSVSGFGQATWHIDPAWDLTSGFRYTFEHKNGSYWSLPSGGAPTSSLPTAYQAAAVASRAAFAPVANYTQTVNNGNASGLVTLSYKVADDVLGYATYARGFKSAGLNLVAPIPGVSRVVQPETVDDYELGIKSKLLDNRLTLNAALFWENDDNYQASVNQQVGAPPRTVSYITNVGSVRSRGIEFDATAVPVAGLTTVFTATYDQATDVSYKNAQCPYLLSYKPSCDVSGSQLAGVSRWALSVSADYSAELGNIADQDLIGYTGGQVFYRSGYFSALNDDPYSRITGYSVVDLHAGLRSEDRRWDVSLWVRNLFDTRYDTSVFVNNGFGLVNASLGDPRTFGLSLAVKL
jgi:iron complex outermembrane receptor protein